MEDGIIISESERFEDIYIRSYNRVNVPVKILAVLSLKFKSLR